MLAPAPLCCRRHHARGQLPSEDAGGPRAAAANGPGGHRHTGPGRGWWAEKQGVHSWPQCTLPLLQLQGRLSKLGVDMPSAKICKRHINVDFLPRPLWQASDCPHLANERIRRLNLLRGKNVVKNLLVEVGRAAQQAQQAPGQAQKPANGAR